MIQLAPMIFGLPVNASILRFNAIWPVLILTQGQAPKTPLKRKFTALLNVLAESFRIDVNLMLLAAKCRLKQNLQHRVDSHSKPRQYALACFNKPPRFAVLNKSADKAAINSLLSGVFTSAYPLVLPFVFGKTGRGGYMPDGFDLPLLRTLPLSCRPAFRSAKRLTLTESKGNIMTQIRKGYSRPLISRKIRSFDTLAEAGRFIDRLTEANRNDYAFNIIQQDNRWTVCSVISGGLQ